MRASRGGWVVSSSSFDPLKCSDLREVYDLLSPNYKGRCTAPLLVDLKSRRIVSNESADIVRTLNTASFGNKKTRADLYPEYLRNEIDQTNQWIYRLLNNGVYRCGFSTTQTSYDAAARDVREGLTRVDALLENQEFLCGDVFTEADLRLLPTMLRFDGAYAPLFKAGGAHTRVRDFQHLHAWLRRCWHMDDGAVQKTVDLKQASESYWKQLFPLNAGGIIPRAVTAKEIGLE